MRKTVVHLTCAFCAWRVVLNIGRLPQGRGQDYVLGSGTLRGDAVDGECFPCTVFCAGSGAHKMIHAVCWVGKGAGEEGVRVVMCVGSDAECDRRGAVLGDPRVFLM